MSVRLRPPKGERIPLVYASQVALDRWAELFPHARPLENVVRDLIAGGELRVNAGLVVGDGFEAVVTRRPSTTNRNRKCWFVLSVRRPS